MAEKHNAIEPFHSEWWDRFDTDEEACFTLEAFCLTCWWHDFDDEKNIKARTHKSMYSKHIVKTKSGLDAKVISTTDLLDKV